jgi:uncharacterized protein (TIGR02118 family)
LDRRVCGLTRRACLLPIFHMIKLTFCLVRRADFTRPAFQAYWRETHAPLVRRHATALRIQRYVQLHTLDGPLGQSVATARGAPAEFDGVAELWWNDFDDIAATLATTDGQAAGAELLEDERRFIDLARSPIFFGEEIAVV